MSSSCIESDCLFIGIKPTETRELFGLVLISSAKYRDVISKPNASSGRPISNCNVKNFVI